ncbi:hypothetical protein [Streptomyces caniscabiei]|uniref:hypothetical protein n=1 Tax=Streptomyces caniscabiei TaxID=2746961 RepID=UPI0029B55A37|nr:hypothetical protein [Streptomyces caniscabiei]MDX2986419.1 hypothetical protein [Streptomyces caniscabiei]
MSRKHPARERLLLLVSPTDAAAHGITPEDAVADAISEALFNQPSLRTCLVPGCHRQFDMLSCLAGDPPPRESWSGEGWSSVSVGTIVAGGGFICPDHRDLVTAHIPTRVKLPHGRWTVQCACGWTPAPRRWHGVLRSLWEEHLLTAMGNLDPEPPLTDPDHRTPLAQHTDDTLTELYDRLEDAEYERNELRDLARACVAAYGTVAPALTSAQTVFQALRGRMAVDSRDWTDDKLDAWLYAILVGWDCEDTAPGHVHNDIDCAGTEGLADVARHLGIDPEQSVRARYLRRNVVHAMTTAPAAIVGDTTTTEETS